MGSWSCGSWACGSWFHGSWSRGKTPTKGTPTHDTSLKWLKVTLSMQCVLLLHEIGIDKPTSDDWYEHLWLFTCNSLPGANPTIRILIETDCIWPAWLCSNHLLHLYPNHLSSSTNHCSTDTLIWYFHITQSMWLEWVCTYFSTSNASHSSILIKTVLEVICYLCPIHKLHDVKHIVTIQHTIQHTATACGQHIFGTLKVRAKPLWEGVVPLLGQESITSRLAMDMFDLYE